MSFNTPGSKAGRKRIGSGGGGVGPTGPTGATGAAGADGVSGGAVSQIAQVTTSGSPSTITFSSIPQTFNELRITFSGHDTSSGATAYAVYLKVNGDATSGNYDSTVYDGASLTSGSGSSNGLVAATSSGAYVFDIAGLSGNANAEGAAEVSIINYAGTSFRKLMLGRFGERNQGTVARAVYMTSAEWKSTAAITDIVLTTGGTAFADNCVCTLYGIGGVGVGSEIYTGAAGAEPAANAGDLYLPNNDIVVERYSGSAWIPWGPIFPLTEPPVVGSWTWKNQGSSTLVSNGRTRTLAAPAAGATDNWTGVYIATPATPYTITAAFQATCNGKSFHNAGMFWSDGTKLVTFGCVHHVNVTKWTSPTVFSADYITLLLYNYPTHIRLVDDGTTRYCYFSNDGGMSWVLVYSVGRTDFLTPTQIGWAYNANNNVTPNIAGSMTLISWKQT